MKEKSQLLFARVLWILTMVILAVTTVQAISGNWITYFAILPGGSANLSQAFLQAMAGLATYHRIVGFVMGGLSILTLVFAFLHKSGIYVRIFAILGLAAMASAAIGGYLFVQSGFQDRWSLGQMSDSFVGVYAAYFIQLYFMNKNHGFPFGKAKTSANS
jgi:hypothetical protein